MVRLLVEFFQIGIEARNYNRNSPLMLAYYYGWENVLEYLASQGAVVGHRNDNQENIQEMELSSFAKSFRGTNKNTLLAVIKKGKQKYEEERRTADVKSFGASSPLLQSKYAKHAPPQETQLVPSSLHRKPRPPPLNVYDYGLKEGKFKLKLERKKRQDLILFLCSDVVRCDILVIMKLDI
mmetsp:Transcript_14855/g.23587  ORF Transcript_14855/g.23587 Transcript_14855/m.23587 type:complete len:181 (-) Transcript_14855:1272-1814(-)